MNHTVSGMCLSSVNDFRTLGDTRTFSECMKDGFYVGLLEQMLSMKMTIVWNVMPYSLVDRYIVCVRSISFHIRFSPVP
jgi:hypothetical protein